MQHRKFSRPHLRSLAGFVACALALSLASVAVVTAGAQTTPDPATTDPTTTVPATTPAPTKPSPTTPPDTTPAPPTTPPDTAPPPRTQPPTLQLSPAFTPPAPIATPTAPAPDALLVQAVDTALELSRVDNQLTSMTSELTSLQTQVDTTDAALQQLNLDLTDTKKQLTEAVARLRKRAAVSYRAGGNTIAPVLSIDHTQHLATAAEYTDAASAVDTTEVNRLGVLLGSHRDDRDALAATERTLRAQLVDLNTEHDKLSAQAVSDQAYLDQIGGVPVMGASRLTAAQLAGWYQSTGQRPKLADGTTIDDLAQMYIEEGAAEHVRGDIAFAQSIIETGSFGVDPGNNYAGIGTCDSCAKGYAFPTPRDGVRAQIQLLRSYADPDSRAANLAHPPEPGVWGSAPVVAADKYDNFFLKGKVPLWNQMGNGNWATATQYAPEVLGVYAKMLVWATDNSTGPPGKS